MVWEENIVVVAPMVELEKDRSCTQNESVALFTSYIPPSALSQLLAHNLPEAHVSPSGARCTYDGDKPAS